VRIHEDVWLKLARGKAEEMAREVRRARMAREVRPSVRRRAADALLVLAKRLSPETYDDLYPQEQPCI